MRLATVQSATTVRLEGATTDSTVWRSAVPLVAGDLVAVETFGTQLVVVSALMRARVAAAVLASDTFNRAGGALGTSDGPGTPTWATTATMTILSNAAKATASNARAFLAAGQADMKVTVKLGSAVASGPCARSDGDTGGTCYRALAAGGTWYIVHVTAGTTATILDSWARAQTAAGDTLGLGATTVAGNVVLTVYHNGTAVRSFTDSVYKLTGTHAGLFAGGNNAIFDDFTVTAS